MKISVVVATYNGENFIIEQLESLKNQIRPADEVIISDDCSTDNTVHLVSEYIKNNALLGWKLCVNETNRGYCINFLDAVGLCTGDLIFLCDQDDIWYEEKIEKMTEAFERNNDLSALCCSCNVVDKQGKPIFVPCDIGKVFDGNDGIISDFSPSQFVGRSFIRGCSVAFKREVFANIVPLDLKGLLSHDWLITFTAALTGRCSHLNLVLFDYRCHESNNSFGKKSPEIALSDRIYSLECSVKGHMFILDNADSYQFMTKKLLRKINKQVIFEKKRIEYLKNGGFINLLKCFNSVGSYRCYKDSFFLGIRVFMGDIIYRKHGKQFLTD